MVVIFLFKYVQRTDKYGINGIIKIPGDKSISHRSVIIPAISTGVCQITNILKSDDVLRTINALRKWELRLKKKTKKF